MRKNLFKISQSEKNRIKSLHETVKNKPQIDGSLNYANTIITEADSGGCSPQSMQISCAQGHGWVGAPICKCQKCKICCQSGTDGSNYQMHEPITVGVGRDNPGTCACPEGSTEVSCGGDGTRGQKHCQCCIDGQPSSMAQTVATNTPCSSLEGGNITNCDTHQIDGGPRTISCDDDKRKDQCQCCNGGSAISMNGKVAAGMCYTYNSGQNSNCQKSPASGSINCEGGNNSGVETCCNCCDDNPLPKSYPGGCPDEKCYRRAMGGNCSEACRGSSDSQLSESSRANSYGEVIYELPARYGRTRMTESQLVRMVKQVSKRR